MSTKLLFTLLIFVFMDLSIATVHSSSNDVQSVHSNEKVKFDYFILALSWPNSYCQIQASKPKEDRCLNADKTNQPQHFTIHGLWPSRTSGEEIPLKECLSEIFKFKEMIPQTKSAARIRWPDLRYSVKQKTLTSNCEFFWTEQWRKHGRCSNLIQDGYMVLAMKKFDVVSPVIISLMKEDQFPSGSTVNIVDFTAAIEKLVGKKPRLVCQKNPKEEQQLLFEIHFHVDKQTEEIIDAGTNSNCDPAIQVQFP